MTRVPRRMPSSAARPRSYAYLQAIEDAIDFRSARLAYHCPDCKPRARCDEHACDARLLRTYRRLARAVSAARRSGDGEAPV